MKNNYTKYLIVPIALVVLMTITAFRVSSNKMSSNREYKKFVERALSFSNSKIEFDVVESDATQNCRTSCNPLTLMYNPEFMGEVKKGFGFAESRIHTSNLENLKKTIDWVRAGVLTHEAGHMALKHCSRYSESNKQAETEADIFMGETLHMLGASLEQAQSCLYLSEVKENGDWVYPTRKQRLENVKKGWLRVASSSTDDIGVKELEFARNLYISGGSKNYKKAFNLFYKNKNKKNFTPYDSYILGMMYVYKLGTKRNVKLGVASLYIAYYAGNEKAEEELLYLIN